jgi:hypothetical protein
MNVEEYRCNALSLPEASEGAHMNHPDFRVRGKVFATLWPDQNRGVLMLTPEQQAAVTEANSEVFAPVPDGWGRRGATSVHLEIADEATIRSALLMAWRNMAPRSLSAAGG